MNETSIACPVCGKPTLHHQHTPNHILHFLITFFTCGLWAIVWIVLASTAGPWRCTFCGTVNSPPVEALPPPVQSKPLSPRARRMLMGVFAMPFVIVGLVAVAVHFWPQIEAWQRRRELLEYTRELVRDLGAGDGVISAMADTTLLRSPDTWDSLGVVSYRTPFLLREERNGLLLIEPLNGSMKGKHGWVPRSSVTLLVDVPKR